MALTILILNKTPFFFSLSHTNDKTKSISLYFFTKHKTSHFSYSVYKHDAIDIADISSMQDACHMNFVIDLVTVKSLWLSSRALDRGIWRSEVGFLMGTQNFFFVPCLWQDEKHLSLKNTMFQLSMGLPMQYTIFFLPIRVLLVYQWFYQHFFSAYHECCCEGLLNPSYFFFLEFQWKDTVADKISTFYDVGGIVGN